VAIAGVLQAAGPSAPPTRVAEVVETLHGVRVADPYRWLEDQQAPEVRAWIDAQNAYTASVLDRLPGRERVDTRLTSLIRIDTVSVPTVRGGRWFYSRRAADQEQAVLYVKKGDAAPEVLVDPQSLSADHTASVTLLDVSSDGRRAAYGIRQ